MKTAMVQKTKVLKVMCDGIISIIEASGEKGMPGGELYAHLMVFGVDLERFEAIMRALVAMRQVAKRGELYFGVRRK